MKVTLRVIAGPHLGKQFTFDGHDTFLVGRASDAHMQLSYDDPYFSRRHFVIEVNPPRCRVLDLKSRNGILVNGTKVEESQLQDGSEIAGGTTVFKVAIEVPNPDLQVTMEKPLEPLPEYTSTYQPDMPAIPGYKILEEIGRGGMGAVFRATRETDGQEVALKTIIPAAGATPKQITRFLREAEILSRLNHPHVVGFNQVGEAGGIIFLTMELVRGVDCARLLAEKGPLPIRNGVRLMIQMLGGLAHAHQNGFVHRDIKPSNILVADLDGNRKAAKLADFGLARIYESSKISGLTMQGELGGTPAYMAPEQVTHYRDVRPSADQYSSAATLYRLLTDKPMHNLTGSIGKQLVTLSTDPPIPIRSQRADIPQPLAEVIHRALKREPEERFHSVLDFRKALMPFAG